MDAFTVESNRRREAAKAEAAGPLAQTSGLRQYRPAPYRSPTQMSGSSPCTKIYRLPSRCVPDVLMAKVNVNTKYRMHTDGFDAGPSRMVALGEFSRGRLWLHASRNNSWSDSAGNLVGFLVGGTEELRLSWYYSVRHVSSVASSLFWQVSLMSTTSGLPLMAASSTGPRTHLALPSQKA